MKAVNDIKAGLSEWKSTVVAFVAFVSAILQLTGAVVLTSDQQHAWVLAIMTILGAIVVDGKSNKSE